MYTFTQKYYIKKYEKTMRNSDAVRTEEKEVLKFGEDELKAWAKNKGWLLHLIKVTSPSGNITSISMGIIARSMEDIIAIVNNAVAELSNSRAINPGMDKIRLDILRQYKDNLLELVNDYASNSEVKQQTSEATA